MAGSTASSRPSFLRKAYRTLWRVLRVVSSPVRRHHGLEGVVIQPYRGYGTADEVYLMGRLFRQPRFGAGLPEGTLLRQLVDALRRFTRWGLGGVRVTARMNGTETCVETDDDGYFHILMDPGPRPDEERLWHDVRLRAEWKGEVAHEDGEVFIPTGSARFVVISDIDDTVMFTGVASKLAMMWRLFVEGAESRVAFPGVAALYRALHGGVTGEERNPMLYVSRGPWSIYDVLERFFRLHRIPVGPILFLREWGLTIQRPLPRRAVDHKRSLLREMLARYHDRPFILIGDSGQHDPEIYADIVAEHPGRVLAVYIRNVSESESRRGEIDALAERTRAAGSPLLLASDSRAMAEHAVEHGWIAPEAMADVAGERAEQGEEAERRPLVEVTAEQAEEAATEPGRGEQPPDVVVED